MGGIRNESAIRRFIANHGPISTAIDAANANMQMYQGGVACPACPIDDNTGPTLDHAVAFVGWGTDPKGGDYWLIKNSWGATWGESGYYRICRGIRNKAEQCDSRGQCYEACGTNAAVMSSVV